MAGKPTYEELEQQIKTLKQAELKQKRTEEELRRSEAKMRRLFDDHAAVKLIIDPDTGRIISANHAAEAFYGWSRETLTKMRIQQINTTPPDKIKNLMADAKEQKRIHFDFQHRLADGSIRDVEVFSSGVEMNGRQYLHSIVHDITERKKAEKEMERLRIQNWQLKKAESLSRMAGAIAHHFNNHMMGIMGNLELSIEVMKQGKSPEKNITEAMEVARKASEISGLMLTYLGQRTTTKAPMDLGEVCRTNLPLLESMLSVKIAIKADLPSTGPMISGNANQIQQVISNFVANAGESYDGEGTIKLSVKTVSAGDIPKHHRYPIDWYPDSETYACLEVADSGCGIPKKDIEKIFDPFFSTKSPGRGLDLPVALGIVKANNGVIAVKSGRGKGSTFSFYIPVTVESANRRPEQSIEEIDPKNKKEV